MYFAGPSVPFGGFGEVTRAVRTQIVSSSFTNFSESRGGSQDQSQGHTLDDPNTLPMRLNLTRYLAKFHENAFGGGSSNYGPFNFSFGDLATFDDLILDIFDGGPSTFIYLPEFPAEPDNLISVTNIIVKDSDSVGAGVFSEEAMYIRHEYRNSFAYPL
jgi:hypothetical protein